MKKIYLLLLLLPGLSQAQKLRVAVAANAQFVMEKVQVAFQKQTGQQLETVVGSSGKLTTQIQQGAPYDVFLSADMSYPNALHEQKLTMAAPVVYAYGSLVLWTLGDLPLSANMSVLLDPKIRHIAIANPKVAPYGAAAMMLLNKRKLTDRVQAKIVYGESISQVNQYLLSGAAEICFTAKSVVLDPAMNGKGHWIDLPTGYEPIAQGVVVLQRTTQPKLAQQFIAFLRSPAARRIFQQFGYKLPTT
jgi:molybdate transport system substrate-binding protein